MLEVKRKKLLDRFSCRICRNICVKPTTVMECLHTFCHDCLFAELEEGSDNFCPFCNVSIGFRPQEATRYDHGISDIIQNILPILSEKIVEKEMKDYENHKSCHEIVADDKKDNRPLMVLPERDVAMDIRLLSLLESSCSLMEDLALRNNNLMSNNLQMMGVVEEMKKRKSNKFNCPLKAEKTFSDMEVTMGTIDLSLQGHFTTNLASNLTQFLKIVESTLSIEHSPESRRQLEALRRRATKCRIETGVEDTRNLPSLFKCTRGDITVDSLGMDTYVADGGLTDSKSKPQITEMCTSIRSHGSVVAKGRPTESKFLNGRRRSEDRQINGGENVQDDDFGFLKWLSQDPDVGILEKLSNVTRLSAIQISSEEKFVAEDVIQHLHLEFPDFVDLVTSDKENGKRKVIQDLNDAPERKNPAREQTEFAVSEDVAPTAKVATQETSSVFQEDSKSTSVDHATSLRCQSQSSRVPILDLNVPPVVEVNFLDLEYVPLQEENVILPSQATGRETLDSNQESEVNTRNSLLQTGGLSLRPPPVNGFKRVDIHPIEASCSVVGRPFSTSSGTAAGDELAQMRYNRAPPAGRQPDNSGSRMWPPLPPLPPLPPMNSKEKIHRKVKRRPLALPPDAKPETSMRNVVIQIRNGTSQTATQDHSREGGGGVASGTFADRSAGLSSHRDKVETAMSNGSVGKDSAVEVREGEQEKLLKTGKNNVRKRNRNGDQPDTIQAAGIAINSLVGNRQARWWEKSSLM